MKKIQLRKIKRVEPKISITDNFLWEEINDEEDPPLAFINDLDEELSRDDSSQAALEDIMRGPTPVSRDLDEEPIPQRQHAVLKGISPKFYFILQKKQKTRLPRKREIIPVNEEIIALAERTKKPFLRVLDGNLKRVRSFVLHGLAPTTLPLISALDEARDVLKEITLDDVNSNIYGMIIKLATTGVEIKTTTFIANYLKLTREERIRFYERIEGDRRIQKELFELQKLRDLQGQEERSRVSMRRVSKPSRKGT